MSPRRCAASAQGPGTPRAAWRRGRAAEAFASEGLVAAGWRVLDRNWTLPGGELDLVIERAGRLRFVEVKARRPGDPSGPESITAHKRRRLIRAARAWLAQGDPQVEEIAFMLALVTLDPAGWTLELLDDPFDA